MSPQPPTWALGALRQGVVIPAHPLALTEDRRLDEHAQARLSRYYHAAGAGGLAVGVHTTQFEIRDHGLLKPVLRLAKDVVEACDAESNRRTVMIAGVCGATDQAVEEARLAGGLGYHAGLVSLAALADASDEELVSHCDSIAHELPIIGFYLQPAVGGRVLSIDFWRRLCAIENLVAVKIAPFDRYCTLDVVRAVAESGRAGDIALYTGNDDNIVIDLLTKFITMVGDVEVRQRIVGGLLGHWACWTRRAVELLDRVHAVAESGQVPTELLSLAAQITDANSALFDPQHRFAGSIAGIHEVLRRQGLMNNLVCLSDNERLSPGQLDEIDRVYRSYPHLNDDEFVREFLSHQR